MSNDGIGPNLNYCYSDKSSQIRMTGCSVPITGGEVQLENIREHNCGCPLGHLLIDSNLHQRYPFTTEYANTFEGVGKGAK